MPKAEDALRAIEIFQGYERWTEECDKVCEAPNKKGRGAGWKDMAAPQKDTKLNHVYFSIGGSIFWGL